MSKKKSSQSAAAPANPRAPGLSPDRWRVYGIMLFLAAAVWLVFGQTLRHEFVNYDDDFYVYNNPHVSAGLTASGTAWALTTHAANNWHPLTWLSHMADCQFYGLKPAGHHFTNVLLHLAAAVLLFLALRQMTGFTWRSAFVAAVFAVHPLRVESVAWVAERKDVLSAVFFMLTLLAYGRYVKMSGARNPRSWLSYSLVLVSFAGGLMCKPMLVTLPVVLLLLDHWPLQRSSSWRLLTEKLPLFALSALSCAITLVAQGAAIQPFARVPLPARLENAAFSMLIYIGQMVWPARLALPYPMSPAEDAAGKIAAALALLAIIFVAAFLLRRKHPQLFTGWLWYVVMLLPVIGIVQVGGQAHADRYTYLPQIGLYLAVTWTAAHLFQGRERLLACAAAAAVIALAATARKQTAYWRNSESLWTHALAVTSSNDVAHVNLGMVFYNAGNPEEALNHFKAAVDIAPGDPLDQYNLGKLLYDLGRVDESLPHLRTAAELLPDNGQYQHDLANALTTHGELVDGIAHYRKALELQPDDADLHDNLATALFLTKQTAEAIRQYETALKLNPNSAATHGNYGYVLLETGRIEAAITHLRKALEIQPDNEKAKASLTRALAALPQDGPR